MRYVVFFWTEVGMLIAKVHGTNDEPNLIADGKSEVKPVGLNILKKLFAKCGMAWG